MGTLLALIIGFVVFEAAGYAFHRLLHNEFMGPLNQAHMKHHLELYPPEQYLSERYRRAGSSSTLYPFLVVGLLAAALVVWVFPLHITVPLLLELAAVGAANSYIHDSTHITGHWMERFKVYRDWRAMHYEHHVDMTKNYGIVTFLADRVFGTYKRQ